VHHTEVLIEAAKKFKLTKAHIFKLGFAYVVLDTRNAIYPWAIHPI